MSLHRAPFFGFLGFSFHFPPRAARFCSVSATHFQQNQILDSLNCGAHSGALRPSRISKTYLSIMLCLILREICPRPSGDAESAAISTSRRSCGLKDSRYPMIRVWFFSQSALSRACSASSSAFLRRAASCLSFAFSAFCRFSSPVRAAA